MEKLSLWEDKEKRKINPKLFSEIAESMARNIAREGGKNKNKNSQLRRYFDEIVRLNTLSTEDKDEDFWQNQILPQVHMLIAKVVYARGRDLVTESFENLIKEGIYQIEKKEDLHIFTNFLEAFMGYYKVYGPK